MKKNIEKGIVVCMVVLLIGIHIACAFCHFTHYDDIGLIVSILQSGDTLWDKLHYNTVIHWTYAPLQCWLVALLVNSSYSYGVNLFLGRFPSLIFSIVNIFLVWIGTKEICKDRKDNFLEQIVAVFMIGASWEMIIYGAQCEPYLIGLTGLMLLMMELYYIISTKQMKFARTVLLGGIVGYMQYQLFVFVFCFYITIFIIFMKDKKKLLYSILASLCSMLISLPVIKDFLQSGMLDRGTNWNVGIYQQYSFNWNSYDDIKKILYFFSFYLKNTLEWFRNMFVYKDAKWFANVLTIGIIGLTIIGLVQTIRKKELMNIFLICSLTMNFGLIFLGKLTYSPSRHTIIFIPIVIYYVVNGIGLLRNLGRKKFYLGSVALCYACIALVFGIKFPEEWRLRENKISEKVVEEWIRKDNPVFVGFYKDTFDLDMMNISGYEKNIGGIWRKNEVMDTGDILILYSRATAVEDEYLGFLDNFLEGKQLELVNAVEMPSDVEVEYAHNSFANYGNGFYKYTYQVAE